MPELPQKRYVRRGEIIAYFGIDKREMTKLVRAGVFTPLYIAGEGRAFFSRAEVIAAETSNKVFKPAHTSR
jgi:hypothetical protein